MAFSLPDSFADTPITELAPAAGVGGVLGYCSGKATKAAGEAAALAFGAAFIFVSLLSKAGYVTINYTKVERDLLNLLDFNKDGKLDQADYVFASKKMVDLLAGHGVSSSAGFAAGFVVGLQG